MKIFMTKWVATLLLVMPLGLLADDMDDVMAVIEAYGDLEGDLAAQAELMHPDRVYITGGMRQTNESLNMRNQIATREAQEALNGGKTEFVTTIEDAVSKVLSLRGVQFTYKKDGTRSTGLIAQDLQKVLPEVVYTTTDIDTEEEHLAVRYGNTVGLLVEAIKEQQQTIDALLERIEKLEKK